MSGRARRVLWVVLGGGQGDEADMGVLRGVWGFLGGFREGKGGS